MANTAVKPTLDFISTLSLDDFKMNQGVSSIDVVKNPHTDKVFFVAGSTTGAVSHEVDYAKPIAVSVVAGKDKVQFFLLHNRNTENILHTL